MSEWILLGVGLVLTVGTGLFVASEFALVNLDRHDLEGRQARGEKRLGPTIKALRITSTHLSSAQLGITLTTLLTGYTFEPAVSRLLAGPLTGLGLPAGLVPVVGSVVGVVLATLFSMIVGELVPKNFALAVPRQTAKLVVPFQSLFTTVFKPVILLLNGTANRIIRSMGIEPKEELSGSRSAEELSYLIRHSATAGLLDDDDATLLTRTLRFAERDAEGVMTPRVRVTTVPVDATAADVVAASLATGFSRFPVVDGTPDAVTGIVHVKSAFQVPLAERHLVLAHELQTPARHVPASMDADDVLTLLRSEQHQIAVVSDEHGGTAGIVTLEDLVEEIVGELEDEHDRHRTGLLRRGRSVSFDASWRPDELADRAGVLVDDDGEHDTVAGVVTGRLGRSPELGDEVEVEGGSLRVERIDGQRIVRLRYLPTDPVVDPATRPAATAQADHDAVVTELKESVR